MQMNIFDEPLRSLHLATHTKQSLGIITNVFFARLLRHVRGKITVQRCFAIKVHHPTFIPRGLNNVNDLGHIQTFFIS